MAEETAGIGGALGLQTNASTGYTGAPLTRAVQMGIQTQMKQDALAAKQAAEQEKLAKELNKYITPPTTQRVSPRWQKANEEVATGGYYRMFQNQNNKYEQGVQKIKTELEAKTIAEQDAYENAVLSRKTLLPKEIRDGVVNDDDGKLKKVDYNWHDYVSPVPVRYTKADGTASEKLSFHANREVPSINFADYNSDIIKARLGGQPKTEIGMVFQNTLGTKKELTDNDLREIASIVVDQDDVAFDNLKGQYEKEGKKYLQQYLTQGKEYEEAKDLALKDVEYDLLKQVYKPVFGTASAKKGGMEFNFGGGSYNINGNTFNETKQSASDNLDLLVAAGVVDNINDAEKNKDLFKNISDFPALASPSKGKYEIKVDGKPIVMDNIEMVYVPKSGKGGGKWFVTGLSVNEMTKKKQKEIIPINESTYGSIISIYPKMTKEGLETMFNERMQEYGITNDTFKLNVNKPKKAAAPKASVAKKELTWAEKQALKNKK